MWRYDTTVLVYMPHISPHQSTIWPKALVHIHLTILAYAPEQICLLHCIYMSHCTATVVFIQNQHWCTYQSKNNKLQLLFTMVLPYMCQQQICPSHATFANYLSCISWGSMPHMNSLSSVIWPEALFRQQWCWQQSQWWQLCRPITKAELAIEQISQKPNMAAKCRILVF